MHLQYAEVYPIVVNMVETFLREMAGLLNSQSLIGSFALGGLPAEPPTAEQLADLETNLSEKFGRKPAVKFRPPDGIVIFSGWIQVDFF